MAVTFNDIPRDLLNPGGYIEFDPSRAGSLGEQVNVLIIGQKTADGTAELDQIYDVGSESDAIDLAGSNAISVHIAALLLKHNFAAQVKLACVGVQGTQAEWPITFSNAPKAGTTGLTISGQPLSIAVAENDEANTLAENMKKAIELTNLAVIAEVADAVLTLKAVHNGESFNDMVISKDSDGLNLFTIGERVDGEGKPNLTALIGNMADDQYDYVINPYLDDANLQRLKTEADRRWGALVQREMRVFIAARHDYTEALAFTENQNTSHFTYVPVGKTVQPGYIWATIIAAVAIDKLNNDPAAPLGDQPLPELIPPAKVFTDREKNTLLHNKCATFNVVVDKVYISYLTTMYGKNAQGHADTAYRDIQVPEILKRMRRIQIYEVMKTYSGYKIAEDASVYAAGQKIMDTDELKGFLYQLYRDRFQREYGWVQDDMGYLDEMIVEIDPDNHDRMNFVDHPRLVGQFRVLAGKTQFLDK